MEAKVKVSVACPPRRLREQGAGSSEPCRREHERWARREIKGAERRERRPSWH